MKYNAVIMEASRSTLNATSGQPVEGSSMVKRVVLGMLVLVVLLSGLYFARMSGTNADAYGNDFSVYYHAAREIISGHDPYQHSLSEWTPYIYPPLLAELVVPLALLPLPVAAYLWFLVSSCSIAAAAWMSGGLASRNDQPASASRRQSVMESVTWQAAIAGCAVVIVLRFVLDTFKLGQVNGIVTALAVAHVYLYVRDRKALSAIALAIAISFKLTPVLLMLYHIAKMRFRFALACCALVVAVTGLSLLPFGSHGNNALQTFVNRTLKNEQGYNFAYSGNQSLRGAIARLTDQSDNDSEARDPANVWTLLISIVILSLSVFSAIRGRTELDSVAPFFCCLVLLSPLSWKSHYVILVLPAAYLLNRAIAPFKARQIIGATLVLTFVLFNLTGPYVMGLTGAEWADAHSLVLAAALLLFIACAAIAVTRSLASDHTFVNLIDKSSGD